ncbi:MAG: PAS domain-containing protein [Pseudomonadota bacterium]
MLGITPQTAVETCLDRHWKSLRSDTHPVPRRAALDPKEITPILEHLILLELEGHGAARFRIGGLRVCQMFGGEVRGAPLHALFRSLDRASLDAICREVISAPAIADMRCVAHVRGMGEVAARLSLRPMVDGNGKVTRIVGTVDVAADLEALAGAQLALVQSNTRPLDTLDAPAPEPFTYVAADVEPVYAAEAAVPYLMAVAGTGNPTPSSGRQHLKLVVSHD